MAVSTERAAFDMARYLVRRQGLWVLWKLKTHLPLGAAFANHFSRDERKFLNRILPRMKP